VADAFSPATTELALDALEDARFEFELAEPEPALDVEAELALLVGLVTTTATPPVELELEEPMPVVLPDPLLPEAEDELPELEAAAPPFKVATTTAVVPVEPEPALDVEAELALLVGLVTTTAAPPVELELEEPMPVVLPDPLLPEAEDELPELEAAAPPFKVATTTAVVPVEPELDEELLPVVELGLDPLLALAPDVEADAPLPTTTLDEPDELELELDDAKTGIAKSPANAIEPKMIFVFFIYLYLLWV